MGGPEAVGGAGGGVVVTNILESSDAYRRGLRYGDHIVAFESGRERGAHAHHFAVNVPTDGGRIGIAIGIPTSNLPSWRVRNDSTIIYFLFCPYFKSIPCLRT